ncbi:MAG: hypothetical protein HY800_07645 [Ignavibacteriales bacterium]|nr:hypothetical protein [Ignavibacteriales bacterium]
MKKYQIMVLGIAIIIMIAGALQTMGGYDIKLCVNMSCDPNDYTYPCTEQCKTPSGESKYLFWQGMNIGNDACCNNGQTNTWCSQK